MTASEFVDVYDTTSGRPNRVPRHWIGDPVLGRNIVLTAEQRELDGARAAAEQLAADEAAEAAAAAAEMAETTVPADSVAVETPVESERPDEEWTAKRIEAFADGADIDLTGAKGSKADMVTRINEVLDAPVELTNQDPDGNQPADETPTGDEEN
ncbi:MAG TPA: hypothetical protein VGE38_07165 [Nocardioides sp.]|uniref:hypothetical protein n=1 Tax=Nocardioides sp. TaxID=35761 RepID=UPI002EDA9562